MGRVLIFHTTTYPRVGSPAVCRFKFTENLQKFNTNSNGADTANFCKHSACLHTQKCVHNVVAQISLKIHSE